MKAKRERRRYPRAELRTRIYFEADGMRWRGTIVNFSEIGLLVECNHLLSLGKKLKIPISLPSKVLFHLQGIVAWSKKSIKRKDHESKQGFMGIELAAVPVEYLNAVADMRKRLATSPARSTAERFEVFHRVKFKSGENFLTEYTENLNQGGMYIATDEQLERDTIIHTQLEIPGFKDPIDIKGRVAYRLDATAAKAKGRTAGVGVQFIEMSDRVRNQLDQYVRRLSIHRSDPKKHLTAEVPSSGVLKDFLVPELLLGFSIKEATGILRLQKADIKKEIFFRKGLPVFAQSSLPSESLGQYLTRRGLLPLKDLAKWLSVLEQPDSFIAKDLVREKFVDQKVMVEALIGYQEERITNAFPWFDGEFEFIYTTEWPETIMMLPLQTHRMVFSGATDWYDATLIRSWMGLNEDSNVRRVKMPTSDNVLSPIAYQILFELWMPQTLKDLSKELGMPMGSLLPASYALIISGWVELEFHLESQKTKDVSKKLKKKPKVTPAENSRNWKKLIEEDFSRLQNLNYFELLGVTEEATEVDIAHAYLNRTARYSKEYLHLDRWKDKDLLHKVSQILAWLRTAHDTLLDPNTRDKYAKEENVLERKSSQHNSFEMDHAVLLAMSEMKMGNSQEALSILEPIIESQPYHPTIHGWYGWTLFKNNSITHMDESRNMIIKAISQDPSDPQFYYFLGMIHMFVKEWNEAELSFLQALRLQENFAEADAGLAEAREHLK